MKIKRLLILAVAISILQACFSKPQGFEVSFDLKNAGEGIIFISQDIPHPKSWYIDTLRLRNGKTVYKGKVDFPQQVIFTFQNADGSFCGVCNLFLDNSKINISGEYGDLKNVTITGSRLNDEYVSIAKKGEQLFAYCSDLSYQQSKAFQGECQKFDSLSVLYKEAQQKVFDYILALPGYAVSPVAAYYVYKNFSTSNMVELEKALKAFDASMIDNPYVAKCRDEWENEKKVLPGQPAQDFVLSDLEGKTYKLSDFRGKYVLLEFSASWCGWCKLEIPYLKTVYDNTKGKEFAMLTVNLDDTRKKWEEDVKENGLPWPVISDLKAFKSPVAESYNISGIPMVYLVSPEGIILEKGLRREAMIERINALFKQ